MRLEERAGLGFVVENLLDEHRRQGANPLASSFIVAGARWGGAVIIASAVSLA